ncbi:acyl carrier protein [Arsenicicoccus piscis]|uniref:Aminoacyl carrier protein n=1 Tax=Arsenicicoccus piscis TaxID=673954 RepID=A0ABQ6HQ17_9MICO|nr:acyl carrier protein [Arsenicicoccus piscis]MCH8628065.1 acyl carrier protein [Arsenicicoccus piscis]GMA20575.1 aminoacyl carrier protein [Arsenicicoccus piscis]
MSDTLATIRTVLAEQGRLSVDAQTVSETADLYAAGLTSHATINVVLGLENAFDIELPDELLVKSTFETIAAISAAVESELGA